jgi:hypothetical protein
VIEGEEDVHAQAVAAEARRARQLRMVVDLTSAVLVQGRLSRGEAEDLVAATRRRALELFPGKEATFELILAPRFARLMAEFVGQAGPVPEPAPASARVLPFRRR